MKLSDMASPPQTITERLLAEIARPGSTRATIAAIYRSGIAAHYHGAPLDFVDWPTVNGALLKRYTNSGLQYIKRLAWKRAVIA